MYKYLTTLSNNRLIMIAVFFGVLVGCCQITPLVSVASVISTCMVRILQFLSLPIIFLSLISTLTGMESLKETHFLGRKVVKYTLMTTLIAASTAMLLFLVVKPIPGDGAVITGQVQATEKSYSKLLIESIPDNLVRPFLEGNVLGIVLIAIAFGLVFLSLPKEQKQPIQTLLNVLFASCLKLTNWVITLLPLAVWAFIVLFFEQALQTGWQTYTPLMWYFFVVVMSNLLQGFVVLPLLLVYHGASPWHVAKSVSSALSIAFFSKSSNAALPITMRSVRENLGVSDKISSFSLPLCSTINMNGCAAFIFTTTVFVASKYGVHFSTLDMCFWVIIATLAAVGNAGVPMGCFFLSGALLTSLHVPLDLMGLILPVYALLDMLETALNVWSDVCVTTVVSKEVESSPLPVGAA